MNSWISTFSSGVCATIVGGLALTFFFSEKEVGPKKPDLSVVSQISRVPAQPIPYSVRSQANPNSQNDLLESVFNNVSSGIVVAQFDVINQSDVVLRDVEVNVQDGQKIFQYVSGTNKPVEGSPLKFNIPPGEKVRLIATNDYTEPTASVTYGQDYYKSQDILEYGKKTGADEATASIEKRYWLVDSALVTALQFILFPLALFAAIGLAPSVIRSFSKDKTNADDESQPQPVKADEKVS
ncbi:hypothetical protein FY134_03010 [Agrobacterium fabrum]|uniref:hypothetical protein n=1 Tax=Agrobacterium fabrum TaxID=1176649 RepID=UPI0021D32ECF|nr:hypothetical protein [Agrobacterium fabrum]UXT56668.1 hypothetical protein FY134_03010 [Agrobacterium fabrum]